MSLQWTGVLFVLLGCGGVGFCMARSYREEIRALQQLCRALNDMEWELQYRITPLPDLCTGCAGCVSGPVREVLLHLGRALSQGQCNDVKSTMNMVLPAHKVPPKARKYLRELGTSLGKYSLQGQLQGLRILRAACSRELKALEEGKQERIRGYQTLALCAGSAIAIILV